MDPEMAAIFKNSTAVSSRYDFLKNIKFIFFDHSEQGLVRQLAVVRQ